MNSVAVLLSQTAMSIQAARRHQQRQDANAELILRRSQMLDMLARQPGLDAQLGVSLLYILDEEIQSTAVAYTSEQRAILEGRQTLPEMSLSPFGLTIAQLLLPPVAGTPAMQALISESRLLVAHPYDGNWWEQPVRDYASRFTSHLINDIEARNEGVPLYRQ
jgi:hypothetical protein